MVEQLHRDQAMQRTPVGDIDMAIDVLREGIKHLQVFKHLQDLRAVFTALIGFVLR